MPLTDVTSLADYRRQREAEAKAPRSIPVTSEPDPDDPNRDWHLIVNENRDEVQAGIYAVQAHVESFGPQGGEAHVHVFRRMGALYFAIIETVRYPDV